MKWKLFYGHLDEGHAIFTCTEAEDIILSAVDFQHKGQGQLEDSRYDGLDLDIECWTGGREVM